MVLISRVWLVNLHAYIVHYLHLQLNCELNKSTKIFRSLFSIDERSLQFLIHLVRHLPSKSQSKQSNWNEKYSKPLYTIKRARTSIMKGIARKAPLRDNPFLPLQSLSVRRSFYKQRKTIKSVWKIIKGFIYNLQADQLSDVLPW